MNLNKVIIIGNLTANPEVKKIPSGQSVATFTIASNRVWTNNQGQKQEQAEFHNIVAWAKLADIVGQYLAKGRLCMVEGRLQTRTWDDQQGQHHWKTEIVAENVQLGPRPQGAEGSNDLRSAAAPASEPESYSSPAPVVVPKAESEEEIKIEDIPF